MEAPQPTCKALLLCDTTIVEAITGKVSLIGCFNDFRPRQLPTRLKAFHVFLQITDAEGRYDFVAELHDLHDDGAVIARSPAAGIRIPNRLVTANIILQVPPLPITHAGAYDMVIFANGQEIERQQFQVREVPDANTASE